MNILKRQSSRAYDIAGPSAPAMMQSLRAFGYDLATAMADLIDNSLTAEAENIWISFEWNGGDPQISITDDGNGMSEEVLIDAMRPGNINPKQKRAEDDLGRFGLGLKTASLSQCQQVTVYSKRADTSISARCWDLDFIEAKKDWALLIIDPDKDDNFAILLDTLGHGTVVRWNKIDKMFGPSKDIGSVRHKDFLNRIDHVKRHISMVFHRFILGSGKVNIFINDVIVESWDPFLSNENATQPLAEEFLVYNGVKILVAPYVLPHRSKLSEKGKEIGGGVNGWNYHQGFYIYRNRRMIVAGSWLEFFQKEEHFKLARILIDLPNSMDEEWTLDVKKAQASPPPELKKDLLRIAKVTRTKASEIYRHRGKVVQRRQTDQSSFMWKQKIRDGKYSYKINRDYPLIKKAMSDGALEKTDLAKLLRLIEETVPTPNIIITNAERPDSYSSPFEKATKEVIEIAHTVYKAYLNNGFTEKEALIRLLVTEPFDLYPELQEIIKPKEH